MYPQHNPVALILLHWRFPFVIATLGFLLQVFLVFLFSVTTDEPDHIRYGARLLAGDPSRPDPLLDSKMPVSVFNALPLKLLPGSGLKTARLPTACATFLLSLLTFHFAFQLFGFRPALFAQCCLLLSPHLLAHGALATTDLYSALTTLLFVFTLYRFRQQPNRFTALGAGAALGLALLSKFSALFLLPLLLFLLPHARLLAVTIGTALLVLNLGYLASGSGTPLAALALRSAAFQHLQQIPLLGALPLPLPAAFLTGLDWMHFHNANGNTFGNILLLGELRGERLASASGFPHYYLIAWLLKEPFGLQLLTILGAFAAPGPVRLLLLAAAAMIVLPQSLFSNTQIGLRHILPLFPLTALLAAAAFVRFPKPLTLSLLAATALSVASWFPHLIPYSNELITDRKLIWHYLADSNLDRGQNRNEVIAFLQPHPDVQLNPPAPTTGRILVSANLLAGVIDENYWLYRLRPTPDAHVGYAHLLITLPSR